MKGPMGGTAVQRLQRHATCGHLKQLVRRVFRGGGASGFHALEGSGVQRLQRHDAIYGHLKQPTRVP